jgi:RNA polymerase sigma-70 factor (ECF subfamily)
VRSLIASREDAADMLQEMGVVVLARDDAPSDSQAFLFWCRGIAHNLALHHWRALRRYKDVFAEWNADQDSSDAAATSVEETLADRESLLRCVEDLDEPSRRLIKLKYVDGKTSRQIARIVKQSPEAVRMRIMRIREGLRDRLARRDPTWRPPPPPPAQSLTDSGAY